MANPPTVNIGYVEKEDHYFRHVYGVSGYETWHRKIGHSTEIVFPRLFIHSPFELKITRDNAYIEEILHFREIKPHTIETVERLLINTSQFGMFTGGLRRFQARGIVSLPIDGPNIDDVISTSSFYAHTKMDNNELIYVHLLHLNAVCKFVL